MIDDRIATLLHLAVTPLDEITETEAGDVVRDVFDRHGEETPVGVARFGSAI
jgi:shikimate kinase